jgi:hypothetical protein
LKGNGKTDRKSLLEPTKNNPEKKIEQPTNEIETKLLTIWKKVLKKDEIGTNNRFFELVETLS